MKKGTKSASRDIIIVSIFIICSVAVLWRRYGATDTENPAQLTQPGRDSLYQQKRWVRYNSKVYLPATRLAGNGDIAVRLGTDFTSRMLSRLNLTDPSYSHAGIISWENDTVFVYHAIGGETNPDQKIVREPLWNFGSPNSNEALGIYHFGTDTALPKKVVNIVQGFYRQQIPFDIAFDLTTKDRMYCTELVSCCFEKALGGNAIFHRSETKGKIYIAVDDITGNRQVQKVGAWRY